METISSQYQEINRRLWNERTTHHINSDFYDMASFLAGATSLKKPELELLKGVDIDNKSLLHLQCHFGQDTLSLARMGALVTGVDFSDVAIDKATILAEQIGIDARFVCCDVYDTGSFVQGQFDIVFSSYGTIGWLPDLRRWAAVISQKLRQGGIFIFTEFHPAMWMFDNSFQKIAYSYFNKGAIIEQEEGTYAERSAPLKNDSVSWNHSLYEVIQALLDEGLRLDAFREFDTSPYDIFQNGVDLGEGQYVIKGMEHILPLMYTLKMSKL